MKPCEDYFDLISARLDGALSPEDAATLEEHLAACPACRLLAADLADLRRAMPALNAAPPADMLPNVMASIHAERSKVLPFAAPAKHKTHWRALGGVAAMLTLALLGAAMFRFGLPTAPEETLPPLLAVDDAQKTAPPITPRSLPTEAPQALPQPTAAPQLTPQPVATAAPAPVATAAPAPVATPAPVPTAAPVAAPAPTESSGSPRALRATADAAPVQSPANTAAVQSPANFTAPANNALVTATAARLPSPSDACKRLYETAAFHAYRATAQFTAGADFTGYQLTPPTLTQDGEHRAADLLEYSGPSENGRYFLFRLCTLTSPAEDPATRSLTVTTRYAVPLDENAEIITEQDDPAAFLAMISN